MGLVRRRWLGTLGWLAAAVGAAVLALWQLQRSDDDAARDRAEKRVMATGAAEDVTSLRIRGAERHVAASRADKSTAERPWRLTAPIDTAADDDVLGAVVRSIVELERESVLKEEAGAPLDRALFGLEPPRVLVEIDSAGSTEVLRVGKKNTFNGHVYVEREGSGVVGLVSGGFLYQIEKQLYDLRDKRIAPFSVEAVERMTVRRREGPTYTVHKTAEGMVLDIGDNKVAGDTDKIQNLWRSLGSARAIEFVNEAAAVDEVALTVAGLHEPTVQVEVALGDGTVVKIDIASRKEESRELVYARVPGGPIARLSDSDLPRRLNDGAEGLRDRHLLRFPRDTATEIVLSGGSVDLAFGKTTEPAADGKDAKHTWALSRPSGAPTEHYKVVGLLFRISDLEAKDEMGAGHTLESLADKGFGPDSLRMLIRGGDKVLGELVVGKVEGERQWVWRASDGMLSQVMRGQIDEIETTADKYAPAPPAAAQ